MKKINISTFIFRLSVGLFLFSTNSCTSNSPTNTNIVSEKGTGVIKGVIFGSNTGLSISSEGDKPVSDASVYLDDLPNFKTKTNADGSFELKDVPSGDHFVIAEKSTNNGTIKARSSVSISKSIPIVDLKSLVVRKTGSIQGLIKLEGSNEKNLLGVDVFIGGSNLVSKTKENGAYALINVAEGVYKVTASQAGYEKMSIQVEVKAGKPSNLDFELKKDTQKLSNIDGVILTETILGSKPLEGVIVSINELGIVSLSDESGKISLSNVGNGTHKLRVYKSGYKLKIIEQKIENDSKNINLGNINLELENKSVLSGKIINEKDKKVIEGVKVNFGPRFLYTNVNGMFSLENIEQGEYTLEFTKGDRNDCSKGITFEPTKKDVIVQLGKTTDTIIEMREMECITKPLEPVVNPSSNSTSNLDDKQNPSNVNETPIINPNATINPSQTIAPVITTPTPSNINSTPIISPNATINPSQTTVPSITPTPIPIASPITTPSPIVTPTPIPVVNTTVSTIAGGISGFDDGSGTNAQFRSPRGLAVDSSGNIFVADTNNSLIRKITSNSSVTTLAGTVGLGVTLKGYADGVGKTAKFDQPNAITVDNSGNIYVADSANNKIRKITSNGTVSTLAGSSQGFADGSASNAQFDFPTGIAVDNSGNIYVSEQSDKIRKITSSGTVSTLVDGSTSSTKFSMPWGIAVDNLGNVYVADTINHKILKITSNGTVSILAGSSQGFADGSANSAKFNGPRGLSVDSSGNVYVADYNNNKIRKITPNGSVSTIAGSSSGFNDGAGTSAQFNYPSGVSVDSSGNVYVADMVNNKIRKIQF